MGIKWRDRRIECNVHTGRGRSVCRLALLICRIVSVSRDLHQNVAELVQTGTSVLAQSAQVLEDAGAVAEAAIKDGASSLLTLESLIVAIGNAAAVKGLNVASDEQVVVRVSG